jgi:hypothetical protein
LLTRNITVMKEVMSKPNTRQQASDGRDALAKFLFDRMFEWLIYRINVELAPKEAASKNFAFIGVLDIFGFEIFSGTVALVEDTSQKLLFVLGTMRKQGALYCPIFFTPRFLSLDHRLFLNFSFSLALTRPRAHTRQSTASSSCASTMRTRNCSSTSTSTSSRWSRKNTRTTASMCNASSLSTIRFVGAESGLFRVLGKFLFFVRLLELVSFCCELVFLFAITFSYSSL